MKCVAAKFVLHVLSDDQKANHLSVCQELKGQSEIDPDFYAKVITGDKSWCYGYNPETKQPFSQWKTVSSRRPKKSRQVRSHVKTTLICFFNIKGVVYHEFVPQCPKVNQHYYLEVLKRLHEAVRKNDPRCGNQEIGFITTTTPLCTQHSVSGSFWPKTK